MKEIIEKLEKIDDRLLCIDKTLVKQEENLQEHMRRTDLAEERLEKLHVEVTPIKSHVEQVKGAAKFISLLTLLTSIASVIYTITIK